MSMDTGEDYAPDFEDAATIPAGVSHHPNGPPTEPKRPPRLNFAQFGHSSDDSTPML
jgi:hypothetical protein